MSGEQDIGKAGDQISGDQLASDAAKSEGRFTDGDKQDVWNKTQEGHKLGEHESATMTALTEADRAQVQTGGYEKFEIVGLDEPENVQLAMKEGELIQEVTDSAAALPPRVSTRKMMEIAKREHNHPTRWKSPEGQGKCNKFLDKVAHEAGMKLPWKPGVPPRSFQMNELLAKDTDFEKVWNTDYSDESLSLENFQYFEMQPGDLVIWKVPPSKDYPGGISHSAIATDKRKIIYAGSQVEGGNGCGHCDVKYFSGEPGAPKSYGSPSTIFRYRNMVK